MKRLTGICAGLLIATLTAGAESQALIEALLKATTSTDPHVRVAAARALGDFGGTNVTATLIGLATDANEMVSAAAADALVRTGGPTVAATFTEILAETVTPTNANPSEVIFASKPTEATRQLELKSESRKTMALRVLSRTGDRTVVPSIVEHGLHSTAISVRIAAVIALGRLKDRAATQPLLELLKSEAPGEGPNSIPVFRGGMSGPLQQMKENSAYLRSTIVWALGEIGDPAGKPAIQRALDDENSLVRDAATEALTKLAT